MRKLASAVTTLFLIFILASFKTIAPPDSYRVTIHLPIAIGTLLTKDTVLYPDETHFTNIQQLTFGGDNAEAYWSYDGKYIVFQRTNPKEGINCDQIFIGKVPATGREI